MRVRRIFRPAYRPRRWGAALAVLGGVGVVAILAVVLPANLFGSANRGQSWRAAAAEVRVVDGETLRLGDRVLRLAGLSAPERGRLAIAARRRRRRWPGWWPRGIWIARSAARTAMVARSGCAAPGASR
jgi:hypothetical protein